MATQKGFKKGDLARRRKDCPKKGVQCVSITLDHVASHLSLERPTPHFLVSIDIK